MVFSKSLALHISLALASHTATDAFAIISPLTASSSCAHSSLDASRGSDIERVSYTDGFRNIAAVCVLTFGFLFPPHDAIAAQEPISRLPRDDAAFQSSTVLLSATIQTMDFSMPSSYDKLSNPIASGKDELVQTIVVNTGSSPKSAAPTGSSAKEEAAAARAERVAQRLAKEKEQAQLDEQAARERDENIKAMRLEKATKRAVAQAEKEAAGADEVEDAKFKGAKFLDTSMPTY
ncbi:hypothetical protein ACHAW5_006727 [Stephanodiscus triporus]|uniref:Uncharacterized protein n=1 Tax=Stephanodiscus triporus TaxID=2934178 RepID=A0ABD3P6G3_9STRA